MYYTLPDIRYFTFLHKALYPCCCASLSSAIFIL